MTLKKVTKNYYSIIQGEMHMSKMEISRRDFLKGAAAGAASLAVMGMGGGAALAEDAPEAMNAEKSLQKWDFEIPPAVVTADVRREEHPSYELTVTPTGVDSETTRPYTSLTTTELVTVPQSDEWMIS
jgi:secreted PhoX family phosphatase